MRFVGCSGVMISLYLVMVLVDVFGVVPPPLPPPPLLPSLLEESSVASFSSLVSCMFIVVEFVMLSFVVEVL